MGGAQAAGTSPFSPESAGALAPNRQAHGSRCGQWQVAGVAIHLQHAGKARQVRPRRTGLWETSKKRTVKYPSQAIALAPKENQVNLKLIFFSRTPSSVAGDFA